MKRKIEKTDCGFWSIDMEDRMVGGRKISEIAKQKVVYYNKEKDLFDVEIDYLDFEPIEDLQKIKGDKINIVF